MSKQRKAFKLKYADGTIEIVLAESALQLIKDRELYTTKHINTRIMELSGEQEAIAFSNEEN